MIGGQIRAVYWDDNLEAEYIVIDGERQYLGGIAELRQLESE